MNAMCAAPPRLYRSNVDTNVVDRLLDLNQYACQALTIPEDMGPVEQVGWLKESVRRLRDLTWDLAEQLNEVDEIEGDDDEPESESICPTCRGTGFSGSGRRPDDGASMRCEACRGTGVGVASE